MEKWHGSFKRGAILLMVLLLCGHFAFAETNLGMNPVPPSPNSVGNVPTRPVDQDPSISSPQAAPCNLPATSLGPISPLSAVSVIEPKVVQNSPSITPPPGAFIDPATGSWAVKVANDFTGLHRQTPGTWAAFESDVRNYGLKGADLKNVVTYNVYNNQGVLKRIEEYVYADRHKQNLSKIITRFYGNDRAIHIETFRTAGKCRSPFGYRWRAPHDNKKIHGAFLARWEIWATHGNLASADIRKKTSDRIFSSHTGINRIWISTEYNAEGIKTRVFIKNPDGSVRQIIYYDSKGKIQKIEKFTPVIDPAKILGPIYASSRANPAV